MFPDSAALLAAFARVGVFARRPAWFEIDPRPASGLWGLAIGLLAALLAVALGFLLKAHSGGGEPLMAVFPILLVTALRFGDLAGAVTLTGGIVGAWYVYLGRQMSFSIHADEARSLVTAFGIGVLMLAVCALLRASNARREVLTASLLGALAQRTEAQAALAVNESQFRASFEGAAVGKAQQDPVTGRIVRANRAFASMLGYEPEELVGRGGWDFTLEEDREIERAEYELVLDGTKDSYTREKRYVRRDGGTVWGRVSATVARSETGAPVLVTGIVENIDAEHRARIELEAATQELKDLLAERTVTLAQRDVLLREVYHRVKNNLQIIDSLLVMQRGQLTDPQAREALAALRARVYALGLVHHQLMGSSDLKTFDIGPFLTELAQNLVRGGASKAVTLTVTAPPLTVGLDFAIPLGLIVTELVTNALKHAFPAGTGAIAILLAPGPQDQIVLTVSDDGVGPPPAPAEGKSLGATIVKALVGQLGGIMTVARDDGYRTEIQFPRPTA